MLTFVDRMMVPQIVQQIGLDPIMDMFNQIATMFGVPPDFKAKMSTMQKPNPEQAQAEQEAFVNNVRALVQAELQPFAQAITDQLGAPVAKMQQEVAAIGQAQGAMNQQVIADNQAIGALGAAIDKLVKNFIPQPGAPLDGGIPMPADSRLNGQPVPFVG